MIVDTLSIDRIVRLGENTVYSNQKAIASTSRITKYLRIYVALLIAGMIEEIKCSESVKYMKHWAGNEEDDIDRCYVIRTPRNVASMMDSNIGKQVTAESFWYCGERRKRILSSFVEICRLLNEY